jgi:putative ABC transport system permease protein
MPLPMGAGSHPERPDQTKRLLLEWDPGVPGRVRYIGGRPPRGPVPRAPGPPVIEVGLDATTAAALGVRAGAELPLAAGTGRVVVRVTGLYRPIAAGDRYWSARPELTGPGVRPSAEGPIYTGVGALDAAGYEAIYNRTDASLGFTWRLPVRPETFTAGRVSPVLDALARLGVAGGQRELRIDSGLTASLTEFRGQLRTARTVLSLALAGLFAVAFGVLALVCRLLAERLRAALATMRARGASLAQLGSGVGVAAAAVALPAAAAGYGSAAALVPGPAALPGAFAVLAAAIALPVALICWTHARAGRAGHDGQAARADLVRRRVTPRRFVLEGLVVALAVAGVVALRTRGLTTNSADQGTDPFLTMVPVLLGCAAGLLTLRGYPYPLRLVGRLTARGRSAVSFVGVARASRQGTVAVLPMIVLLLATAVAGYAGVVDSGLRRAQERSAWLTAGAETRVDGLRLNVDGAERIRRVPGVRDVVPARFVDGATFNSSGRNVDVTIVAVDLAAYRRLVAGSPIRPPAPPRAGSNVPALLSPGLTGQIGPGPYTATAAQIPDLAVRAAGTIDGFSGVDGPLVIVPYRALGADAVPTAFFVSGADLDVAGLRRAAGGDAVVTTRAGVYDRLTGAPMVTLVRTAFGYSILVVAGYATLAILLALIIGSGGRGQTVSYLRTLGLSRGQARRLAITEVGPALLCAAVAGWVVGLLLPRVVGSAIDLRPYTGGLPATGFVPDPLMTAALAAGLIVFGGLAIAVDTLISSRRRLGTTLRMGAQP